MDIDSCYQLGYVISKHGLNGGVNVFLDVDDPEYYREMESVFIAIDNDETLVPFFIDSLSLKDNKAIIKFEGVDTPEEAERLVSCEVYLPLEFLPPLKENQFYFHEIIGYQVKDINSGDIGCVRFVYPSASQDLLSVLYREKEVLIPITDYIIKTVDKENKTLIVDLPDGLLDIYLE